MLQTDFKLRDQHGRHPSPHMSKQSTRIKAMSWRPNCVMPGWTSYAVDPSSLPGKLLVVTPDGEGVAMEGDMLLLSSDGRLVIMDPDTFAKHYAEVS